MCLSEPWRTGAMLRLETMQDFQLQVYIVPADTPAGKKQVIQQSCGKAGLGWGGVGDTVSSGWLLVSSEEHRKQ